MDNIREIEFMKYDPTPGEKHCGIVTIRYEKRFIFRFKIVPKENGGFFVQSSSHKVIKEGTEIYLSSFQIESCYESDEIKSFILSKIETFLKNIPVKTEKEPVHDQWESKVPF